MVTLPEQDEQRWAELEAKRKKLEREGKALSPAEYEEWLALDQRKFPRSRDNSGNARPRKKEGEDLTYAPTPKHRKGGWGTEMDLDDKTAQEVLNNSVQDGKQRYGYHNGKVYVFQPDNVGGYHGYPIKANKIPGPVLKDMKKKGLITEAQYRKLLREM